MFCSVLTKCRQVPFKSLKFAHSKSELAAVAAEQQYAIIDTRTLPSDDYVDVSFKKPSTLDKCDEDISHVAPYLKPSFNFAAYANKSETLQELLKLGVNLHKLEKKVTVPPFILRLDFERDIKNRVVFLHELGVGLEEIGCIITKNPYIFKEQLDDLEVRVNYLKYKKFSNEMILRILTRNPFWLMYSTQRIDDRLGFFQNEFSLTGNETRNLAHKQPKLITYSIKHVKMNAFSIREEMGFTAEETKQILLNKPNTFMKDHKNMLKTFECIHQTMQIPLEVIAKLPEVLTCREFKVKQRHLFLEKLGKNQYNPKLPNYVSVLTMVTGTDAEFCLDVAKSTIQAYNSFLKSL